MTTQTIGETTFTTPTDTELVVTRDFAAPRRLLFEAWTSPAHLPHWMLGPPGWTMPICESDLRPGGEYRYVWRRAEGTEMEIRGVHREIAPPERLVFTESWGGEWPDTLNTVAFAERGGGTRVTTTVAYPSREARDKAMESGMLQGIALSFDRLAEHLEAMR